MATAPRWPFLIKVGESLNILFDHEHLLRLLTSLHTLTGVHTNIFDMHGKDIQITEDHAEFCRLINSTPEGHARCEACDAQAAKKCLSMRKTYHYRCHAGICEEVLPIFSGEEAIAYMVFGQLLDDSGKEQQWEQTKQTLDWYEGDMEELEKAFFAMKQFSEKEFRAHSDLLEALAAYINLKEIIRATEHTELQKLENYLNQHYMEKLSLASISADLNIGRTKLCALARQLSGGSTLTHMIAQRRVNAAKLLLSRSDTPVSTVAEAVGISDYNYFSKVFRNLTGMTPSAFRKAHRAKTSEKTNKKR